MKVWCYEIIKVDESWNVLWVLKYYGSVYSPFRAVV